MMQGLAKDRAESAGDDDAGADPDFDRRNIAPQR